MMIEDRKVNDDYLDLPLFFHPSLHISPVAASDAPEWLARGSVVDQSETLVLCGGHVQAIVLQVSGWVSY